MKPNLLQYTPGWWLARRGKITGSRAHRVVHGTVKGWTSLMDELRLELEKPEMADQWAGKRAPLAIRWGHYWETPALEQLEFDYGFDILRPGFKRHPVYDYAGCSADGLVMDGFTVKAIIEVKCPLTVHRHMRVVSSGEVPDEHFAQIDMALWTYEVDRAYFVSYNPTMPDHETQLAVVEVERNEKRIARLAAKAEEFAWLLKARMPVPRPSDRIGKPASLEF